MKRLTHHVDLHLAENAPFHARGTGSSVGHENDAGGFRLRVQEKAGWRREREGGKRGLRATCSRSVDASNTSYSSSMVSGDAVAK